jgi:hypothetical protein
MDNKKITKNFSLNEFKVSAVRPDLAEKITFTKVDERNIELLCIIFLQPLRDEFGYIKVLSGKRSHELNKAIGGSANSDHLKANAVDIVPLTNTINGENTISKMWKMIIRNKSCIGQAILYIDNHAKNQFIHISLPTKQHCGEMLLKVGDDPRFRPFLDCGYSSKFFCESIQMSDITRGHDLPDWEK